KQFALTIAASTIISAFNSLTLSPALAALMLKPHGHGHGHQEALPRLGIAIIGGLVAYAFLLAPAGHLVGIEVGGHGHGSHDAAASENPLMLWGLKAGVFAVGLLGGWLAGGLINRLLGAFFKAFNWLFDVTINGYGRVVGLLLRLSVIALLVYGGL